MSIKKYRKKCLSIMTWNIYFGADLSPLINTCPEEVQEVVTKIFNQVQQTDFHARAKSITKQICRVKPDLIGLQEVALWTVQSQTSNSVINFLDILLKDLKELNLDYKVIAINRNFNDRLPSSTGDIIGMLDRDVILAKSESPFKFTNIQEENFRTNLVVPVGGEPLTILRGWSSVDISLHDKKFRLVNTHLEGESATIRFAQAKELLMGPGSTELPLIFIGDFNSNGDGWDSPTYDLLIDADFMDIWDIAGKGCGFTAFQARDLLNSISTLSERIDLILFRDDFYGIKAKVIGNKQRDRTPCGLWSSDHAGVVARLQFEDDWHWFWSF